MKGPAPFTTLVTVIHALRIRNHILARAALDDNWVNIKAGKPLSRIAPLE